MTQKPGRLYRRSLDLPGKQNRDSDLPASICWVFSQSFFSFRPMTFVSVVVVVVVLIFHFMFRRALGQGAAKMSTYTTDKASPFTRAVISSMRKLYADPTRSLLVFFFFCARAIS